MLITGSAVIILSSSARLIPVSRCIVSLNATGRCNCDVYVRLFRRLSQNKKLSYRWQTARRICAICNGVANPLKHISPLMDYRAEFDCCWSTCTCLGFEICQKDCAPRVLPFKVVLVSSDNLTRIDRLPMTSCFSVSNSGLCKRDSRRKL